MPKHGRSLVMSLAALMLTGRAWAVDPTTHWTDPYTQPGVACSTCPGPTCGSCSIANGVNQSWVFNVLPLAPPSNGNTKRACIVVKNDPGTYPLRPTKIQIAIWNTAGTALDPTATITSIKGGWISAVNPMSPCVTTGSVTLFSTACNSGTALTNNSQWTFRSTGGCALLPAATPTTQYLTINEIMWSIDTTTIDRKMDVNIYYTCDAPYSGPELRQPTTLHTP